MREILFLNPVFKERPWGGNRLKTDFAYDIPSGTTGECWAISAHPEGDCIIANGSFHGSYLSTLWKEQKELFGDSSDREFPLLVKIIDAKEDLSIQVHPDDTYAMQHENGSYGKTECWYILDCQKNGTIIVGHHANSKEELKQMLQEGRFAPLLNVREIKKGDFIQIPPGTLHAIKAGTLLLETQQSSDITYRVYDYNRLENGKPRELHLQKSLEVIKCPDKEVEHINYCSDIQKDMVEELISCGHYTVNKLTIDGVATLQQDHPFLLCSVIAGEGYLDQYKIKKGDHFIIPYNYGTFEIKGNVEMIVSHT